MAYPSNIIKRIIVCGAGVVGLGLVFVLQRVDFLWLISQEQFSAQMHFSVNRVVRIFFNDAFMLLVLYGLFADMKVLRLALAIQAIDLLILLPLYLVVKLYVEGDSEISSPFLSQFHRLIVNPTLMILIIPAVYYQKFYQQNS